MYTLQFGNLVYFFLIFPILWWTYVGILHWSLKGLTFVSSRIPSQSTLIFVVNLSEYAWNEMRCVFLFSFVACDMLHHQRPFIDNHNHFVVQDSGKSAVCCSIKRKEGPVYIWTGEKSSDASNWSNDSLCATHSVPGMSTGAKHVTTVLTLRCFLCICYLFQRDTTGLSNENTELKLRLQAMEQQAQLRDGKY